MSKTTRALSGAAKNAFLDGVVRSALGEDHAGRERLMKELISAVASLRVRVEAERAAALDEFAATAEANAAAGAAAAPAPEVVAAPPAPAFDPYSPNIVVVLRRDGRDAAVAALMAIGHEGQLRLLAKEQQLGILPDEAPVAALCEAIVAAAERRVANRRAAGS